MHDGRNGHNDPAFDPHAIHEPPQRRPLPNRAHTPPPRPYADQFEEEPAAPVRRNLIRPVPPSPALPGPDGALSPQEYLNRQRPGGVPAPVRLPFPHLGDRLRHPMAMPAPAPPVREPWEPVQLRAPRQRQSMILRAGLHEYLYNPNLEGEAYINVNDGDGDWEYNPDEYMPGRRSRALNQPQFQIIRGLDDADDVGNFQHDVGVVKASPVDPLPPRFPVGSINGPA